MMDLFRKHRIRLAAALAVALASPTLPADEPIAAPPAPVIDSTGEIVPPVLGEVPAASSQSLAPVATDAPDDGIVPAGRRDAGGRRGAQGSLDSAVMGGDATYYPGGEGQFVETPQQFNLPEGSYLGEVSSGEYGAYADINPYEATVRISDKPADQVGTNPPGVKLNNRVCPECRYCQHGLPYHQCPECEPSEQMVRRYTRRHGIVYPMDYGWSPPAKHPIDRVSIDYYRAFPANWGGTAQRGPAIVRPSVYWPTDTTQLGYTYQQTPRWMPYPGMVPPVPHPGQWNIPLNGPYANGACPQCRGNAAGNPNVAPLPPRARKHQESNWVPTDVTRTNGPALNATAEALNLTPVH
ncbi:MAG: hypothetical protein ACK5Q5_23515 [Planctomycetaceae bacterium]